jgi:hypothetical protein
MKSVNAKYLIALILVAVVAAGVKLMNPNKKYSTREFWQTATVESVAQVPEAALKAGNRNGGVLMWVAMGTENPEIFTALVARGADVNEVDPLFSGTPLTAAASYSSNPAIIRELIRLGADTKVRVNNASTALMVAAMYNTNPGVIEELLAQGADINAENAQGDTARALAVKFNNRIALNALSSTETINTNTGRVDPRQAAR